MIADNKKRKAKVSSSRVILERSFESSLKSSEQDGSRSLKSSLQNSALMDFINESNVSEESK
jgi:hypothetical protein